MLSIRARTGFFVLAGVAVVALCVWALVSHRNLSSETVRLDSLDLPSDSTTESMPAPPRLEVESTSSHAVVRHAERSGVDGDASFSVVVRGRFVDDDELGLRDVRVVIESEERTETLSDSRGEFELSAPLSEMNVGEHGEAVCLTAARSGYAGFRQPLKFRGARTIDIGTVRLTAGFDLYGRVLDERGVPAADVDVFLLTSSSAEGAVAPTESFALQPPRSPFAQCRTERGGRYAFFGLVKGAWEVWAQSETSYCTNGSPLNVTAGQTLTAADIQLRPLPSSYLIEGVVLGPDGLPSEGAGISYRATEGGFIGGFETAPGGRFTLRTTRANQSITLVPYAASPGNLIGEERDAAGGERNVVLRLRICATLDIVVQGEDSSRIERYGWMMERRTDPSPIALASESVRERKAGQISVCDPGGDFTLRVLAPGYAEGRCEFKSSARQRTATVVTLRPLIFVRGTVCTAEGAPIAGALVQLANGEFQRATGSWRPPPWEAAGITSTRSDAQGKFSLQAAQPGMHCLGAFDPRYAPTIVEDVEAVTLGGRAELKVVLSSGAIIQGAVLVPDGQRAEGLEIVLLRGSAREATTRVDSSGHFTFSNLMPGLVSVRAVAIPWRNPPGTAGWALVVDLEAATEAPMTIDLRDQ